MTLVTPTTTTTTFDSLDIANMYSNVPISETRKIIEDFTLNNMVDPDIRHELLSWFDTITNQNYFLHNNNTEGRPCNGCPLHDPEPIAQLSPQDIASGSAAMQQYDVEPTLLPISIYGHRLVTSFRHVYDRQVSEISCFSAAELDGC